MTEADDGLAPLTQVAVGIRSNTGRRIASPCPVAARVRLLEHPRRPGCMGGYRIHQRRRETVVGLEIRLPGRARMPGI